MNGFAAAAYSEQHAATFLRVHTPVYEQNGQVTDSLAADHEQHRGSFLVERQQIMSGLQTSGAAVAMRQGMTPGHMGETQAILEQVSALAANTAVHQEIVMHMCRRFILQVCPVLLWQSGACRPEHLLRIYVAAWPRFQDLGSILRQVVEGA
ncbi:hypothetical protein WJX84_003261 [Apatococcus fuscideae]|uniref:Uncharacterized protein n=1 Tax=Apatococcus fuscideae TaxID=2026836 RepID=A0AAW1SPM8_9CHLO